MIEVTGIKSKNKPIEIDDNSSETTVYVRHNIEKITEEDPVFKTKEEIYIYDETQYSFAEWYRTTRKEIDDRLTKLEKNMELILNNLEIEAHE